MSRRTVALLLAICMAGLGFTACGGDASADQASCSIEQSDLGPFSPDTPLGESMSEDQARARMAEDGIVDWIAVTATGPWDKSWDIATDTLGGFIHTDLTWLDVNGQISGLYQPDDAFEFRDLRVSRSFQGKIQHSKAPLYLPLQQTGDSVNFDANCSITALEFGDATNDRWLDVFSQTAVAQP